MRYFLFLLWFPVMAIAQQAAVVDFAKIAATISTNATEKKVSGRVNLSFSILQVTDSIYLDAIDMKVSLYPNPEGIVAKATQDKLWFIHPKKFQQNINYTVQFEYQATPKQTLYFTGDQIWTQGQGKYTSHWLPSIDDMNDKIEFDLSLVSSEQKTMLANGQKTYSNLSTEDYVAAFDMEHPMSSYLAAIVMGDFYSKELQSSSGVPIQLYISTKDTTKWESTYRYSKEIFDFLETEIGIPYPWQSYKQVPVRDFLYAGMENTTLTIFSEAFVVDAVGFNDRNYVNVNAHELAHQWFGNLVTETSSSHHWLHEGFATYYALLAEKELFGEDYYYWKLYNTAEQLKALSDEGKGQSLLDPKASSLIFYEKGAWALHILRELVGDTAFKAGIKNFLQKHAFSNVTVPDFLNEIKAVSAVSIESWEKDWLTQTAFKAEQAYESLLQSPFINQYFEISALRGLPLSEKETILKEVIVEANDFIGQEAVYQLATETIEEALPLYKIALSSDNLFIRQAVATTLETPPAALQEQYESLLQDNSYATQEAALYTLWSKFPERRNYYLDTLKSAYGFQNKSLRQLWLVLAIYTEGYKISAKPIFKEELRNYTSPEFSFEIRESAFQYINSAGFYNEDVIDNLIDASVHHNWRFRSFARSLLDEILKNPGTKTAIQNKLDNYSEKERAYLNKAFNN